MATTAEQALAAKQRLRQQLGRPAWLRGIGVGKEGDDHVIEVRVAQDSPEVRDAVPLTLDDVRVHVVAVGDVRAG